MIYIYPKGEYALAIAFVKSQGKEHRIVTGELVDPTAEAVYCTEEKIAKNWTEANVKLLDIPKSFKP